MNVSPVRNNNQIFSSIKSVSQQSVAPSEQPKKKGNVKKALVVASAAAASVGVALLAINKIKKGQALTEAKKVTNQLKQYFENTKLKNDAKAGVDILKKQMDGVARRTKPSYVAKRADDLAKAFGAVVEHVPQVKSIVG